MSYASIRPRELQALEAQQGAIDLIDVRTPAEFGASHIGFARNVPLERLDPAAVGAERRGGPLYVVCQAGGRSRMACEKLAAAGLGEIVNVEGGTNAWEQAGLPVVRGKQVMSLERQVRIAAGSLVLWGIALAYFVHPYLIGIAAFVGAGLVFAGVTDTCGMGMLLAKMPWNQASGGAAGATCEAAQKQA